MSSVDRSTQVFFFIKNYSNIFLNGVKIENYIGLPNPDRLKFLKH